MSLTSPYPMWATARSPFEVKKAVVVARMLSGRYRTDRLVRHWSTTNPTGVCLLPGCSGEEVGSLEHILVYCPALSTVRSDIVKLWSNFMVPRKYLFPVVSNLTKHENTFMQLLLDPSSIPSVITATQESSDILPCCFYLSRTWIYSIHLRRMKLMKIWNLT